MEKALIVMNPDTPMGTDIGREIVQSSGVRIYLLNEEAPKTTKWIKVPTDLKVIKKTTPSFHETGQGMITYNTKSKLIQIKSILSYVLEHIFDNTAFVILFRDIIYQDTRYIAREEETISQLDKYYFYGVNFGDRNVYAYPSELSKITNYLIDQTESLIDKVGYAIAGTTMLTETNPKYLVDGYLTDYAKLNDMVILESPRQKNLFTKNIHSSIDIINETNKFARYIDEQKSLSNFPSTTPLAIVKDKGLTAMGIGYTIQYEFEGDVFDINTVYVNLSPWELYVSLLLLESLGLDQTVNVSSEYKGYVVNGTYSNPRDYTIVKNILTTERGSGETEATVYDAEEDYLKRPDSSVGFHDKILNKWVSLSKT